MLHGLFLIYINTFLMKCKLWSPSEWFSFTRQNKIVVKSDLLTADDEFFSSADWWSNTQNPLYSQDGATSSQSVSGDVVADCTYYYYYFGMFYFGVTLLIWTIKQVSVVSNIVSDIYLQIRIGFSVR